MLAQKETMTNKLDNAWKIPNKPMRHNKQNKNNIVETAIQNRHSAMQETSEEKEKKNKKVQEINTGCKED